MLIEKCKSGTIIHRNRDNTIPKTVYAALEQIEGPKGGIYSLGQYGGWNTNSPSQNLVDAFGMTDGLPISHSPLYNPHDPYPTRNPRFYADINYDEVPCHGLALLLSAGLPYTIKSNNKTNPR